MMTVRDVRNFMKENGLVLCKLDGTYFSYDEDLDRMVELYGDNKVQVGVDGYNINSLIGLSFINMISIYDY